MGYFYSCLPGLLIFGAFCMNQVDNSRILSSVEALSKYVGCIPRTWDYNKLYAAIKEPYQTWLPNYACRDPVP